MKRINLGLIHYVFLLVIVLFIFVSNSSCKVANSVAMQGKDIIVNTINNCNIPVAIIFKIDTSDKVAVNIDTINNGNIIGDVIYDNLFK